MAMERKKRNILFICYGNINRSPTAAEVCKDLAIRMGLDLNVISAGIATYSDSLLTKELADEADIIFVMEDYMKQMLLEYHGQAAKKIVVLDIQDMYERNDPELVQLLEKVLPPYLL
jgi:predicted protein tyrosine phosphatase